MRSRASAFLRSSSASSIFARVDEATLSASSIFARVDEATLSLSDSASSAAIASERDRRKRWREDIVIWYPYQNRRYTTHIMTGSCFSCVLESDCLAPLIARHLRYDVRVDDLVGREKQRLLCGRYMPSLHLVSRGVRAACARAFDEGGYLQVRCRHVAYTLVPFRPEETQAYVDEDGLLRTRLAPAQLPLAWRVTVFSPEWGEVMVGLVHPVSSLWRRTFDAMLMSVGRSLPETDVVEDAVHESMHFFARLGITYAELLDDLGLPPGTDLVSQDVAPMLHITRLWMRRAHDGLVHARRREGVAALFRPRGGRESQ